MRKIIIHTEEIKKQGAKLQFQIKLPDTTINVSGILVTLSQNGVAVEPPPGEGELEIVTPYSSETGWIWLRIPEKRDVFYADNLKFSDNRLREFHGIKQPEISSLENWWFSGTKRNFFKVSVPVENTIIDGFYIDRSTSETVDYKLRIYLELKIIKPQLLRCRKEQP